MSAPLYKLEYFPDAPGVTPIKPVSDVFADAADYRCICPIKTSTRYDNDGAHDIDNMMKKATVQRNDRAFNSKDLLPIIAVLQEFMAV